MPDGPNEKWLLEKRRQLDAISIRPKRKKLNAKARKELKVAALQLFVKQYGRKAQKRTEPNDRKYSRDIEKAVRAMDPAELSALLSDGTEE